MVKEIIPDDRKDDIAYLEAMLQEVAKCLANKVYEDWKRTNRLIRKDIAMVVTPMDIVGYYKNIIEARTEDTIKDLEDKVIEDFDEFMKDFKDE
tara:strand:+ start:2147 stop:2428 length:282 start_codon:yes stop_codon:yes gene_type:complete